MQLPPPPEKLGENGVPAPHQSSVYPERGGAPSPAPKVLGAETMSTASCVTPCRVQQFEADMAESFALLQKHLVSQFEVALNGAPVSNGLPIAMTANALSFSNGKLALDRLPYSPSRYSADLKAQRLEPQSPEEPRPASPRLHLPPDLETWEEEDKKSDSPSLHIDAKRSTLSASCEFEPHDHYSLQEEELLDELRLNKIGRWYLYMLRLVDREEGFGSAIVESDEVTFEIWEAWTTMSKVKKACPATSDLSVFQVSARRSTDTSLEFEEPCYKLFLQGCVMHPSSPVRFPWVCIGGLLILLDTFYIPMRFVDLCADFHPIVARLMLFYWMLDIVFSFFVGFSTSDGRTEMRFKKIVASYSRTWFTVDLAAVGGEVGLFILDIVDMETSGDEAMRLARILRLVRLVKLLRLRKLMALVREMFQDIRTDWVILIWRVLEHLSWILMTNHYIACGWYGVSTLAPFENSWVNVWRAEEVPTSEAYVMSLHWSLTQFTPSTNNIAPENAGERLFAIFVVIFALVSFSSFVSGVTNAVNELRTMNLGLATEGAHLRTFLAKKNVSTELGGRMINFFLQNYRRTKRSGEADIPFFKHFPQSILVNLHREIYLDMITLLPAFSYLRRLDATLLDKLCHTACADSWYLPNQDIFITGNDSKKAYFTDSGTLDYIIVDARGTSYTLVPDQTWMAEVCLWIRWTHVGNCSPLRAVSVIELDAYMMRTLVVKVGGPMHSCLKKYVAFLVGYLEGDEVKLTDMQLEKEPQLECVARAHDLWLREAPAHDDKWSQQAGKYTKLTEVATTVFWRNKATEGTIRGLSTNSAATKGR